MQFIFKNQRNELFRQPFLVRRNIKVPVPLLHILSLFKYIEDISYLSDC